MRPSTARAWSVNRWAAPVLRAAVMAIRWVSALGTATITWATSLHRQNGGGGGGGVWRRREEVWGHGCVEVRCFLLLDRQGLCNTGVHLVAARDGRWCAQAREVGALNR